jgi:hypothetical protein
MKLRVFLIILLILLCVGSMQAQELGGTFLTIFPSARASALAGAIAALSDGPDAAYWNPGALGFATDVRTDLTGSKAVPGLWQGEPCMSMFYGDVGVAYPLPGRLAKVRVGLNLTYFHLGSDSVIDYDGHLLGVYPVWRGGATLQGAMVLWSKLGIGVGLKAIRSSDVLHWWLGEIPMPYSDAPDVGYDNGIGTTVALDAGALYKPVHSLAFGAALANLGPSLESYYGGVQPLPAVLRLAACYAPLDVKTARCRLLLELDKVLPRNWLGTEPFVRSLWKGVAAEVTLLQTLSLRGGYFSNPDWHRGGLTYGFGLGYRDLIRLDVSNDGGIYNFPTTNWRATLNTGDLLALIRAL